MKEGFQRKAYETTSKKLCLDLSGQRDSHLLIVFIINTMLL